ncbi:MAG TPA: hypothetical protein VLM79_16865, partial [Kofleriaceae bacterium]|nr:hypothetical protein [Kofleriaceae bacterium]
MRCWYTRWQLSNALDGGDLAARMARGHAAGCASCQAFGRSLGALHADLTRTARTATRPVTLVRGDRRPMVIAGSLAVGAAAVLVLAVSAARRPAAPPDVSPVAITETLGESLGRSLGEPLGRMRGVADRFSEALARTPLDTELDALIKDGRRGFDALIDTTGL